MATVPGPRTRQSLIEAYENLYWVTNGVPGTAARVKTYVDSKTISDVVIEDFYHRREQGELFNNPLTLTRIKETFTTPDFSVAYGANKWSGYATPSNTIGSASGHCGPPTGRDAMIATAKTYCATKALGKCSSEVTQGLVTLGELRETKAMLRSAAIHLLNMRKAFTTYVDLLFDYRNSLPKQAGIVYKHVENAWMQLRMGWRPLSGEIENTVNAWNHLESKVERQTFRDFERLTFTNSDTLLNRLTANLFYSNYKRTYTEQCDVRAGVLCQMKYGGVPDVWGVTKLPQTIWELTTLSWCLDYFFNVADVIAAYTPDSLWRPEVRWVTVESVIVQEFIMTSVAPRYANQTVSCYPSKLVKRTYSKVRTPNPAIGFAGRPTSLDDPELLDTIAVVRQKIMPIVARGLELLRR